MNVDDCLIWLIRTILPLTMLGFTKKCLNLSFSLSKIRNLTVASKITGSGSLSVFKAIEEKGVTETGPEIPKTSSSRLKKFFQ